MWRKEAKRRKAHANHPPWIITTLRLPMIVRVLLFGPPPPSLCFDRGSRRDSHPTTTPGRCSWALAESSGRYLLLPVPVQRQTSRSAA